MTAIAPLPMSPLAVFLLKFTILSARVNTLQRFTLSP